MQRRPRFSCLDDPLAGSAIALAELAAGDRGPGESLVRHWVALGPPASANPDGSLRYRWTINARLARSPGYVAAREAWRPWRPAEREAFERDRKAFEERLIVPIVLSESVELLDLLGEDGNSDAVELLTEALPRVRRDIARFVVGDHAWSDTWALWNLTRRPHALRRLHPFALALADTYAEHAVTHGYVGTGSRFPFHDRPLVSVSAQLAAGLVALGMYPKLTGRLATWVASTELASGGWADADEPPDLLTTLVAASLLAGLDPAWEPAATADWIEGRRRADGVFAAFGPEVAWLTLALDELLSSLRRPFEERFRWPQLATEQRDRRTRLPFLGYLADLARLFAEVPSLAAAPVELAFLDLAGFGEWNNRFGMATGDAVLRFLADTLSGIAHAVAVRDGGDEFLVVGAPGLIGLGGRLDELRAAFPARFRARFGGDLSPVAPRILTTTVAGARLVEARDRLGVEINALKRAFPSPPLEGVRAVVEV